MNRREFLIGSAAVVGALAAGGYGFVHSDRFGRLPTGERLRRIQASPHYINGRFECLHPVKSILKDESQAEAIYKMITADRTGWVPEQPMLAEKTDLFALRPDEDCVVWMGHSTFYLQLAGKRILIDPVFSDYGAPVFFINKAFAGSNVYQAEDIPELDVLLMSHDHWDHLDYPTVMALKPKVKSIVCPLGVGEYFEQWGFDMTLVHEEDWDTDVDLGDGFHVHVLPSQHFSGRFLDQNQTEWCSFALTSPTRRIYLSCDGGYGDHFTAIGEQFGGFNLAIMENGQYNEQWHPIHLLPPETVQAAVDVGAKKVMLAHNSKFCLARHKWEAPMADVRELSAGKPYELLTPKIGQYVNLDAKAADFESWWEQMV